MKTLQKATKEVIKILDASPERFPFNQDGTWRKRRGRKYCALGTVLKLLGIGFFPGAGQEFAENCVHKHAGRPSLVTRVVVFNDKGDRESLKTALLRLARLEGYR